MFDSIIFKNFKEDSKINKFEKSLLLFIYDSVFKIKN